MSNKETGSWHEPEKFLQEVFAWIKNNTHWSSWNSWNWRANKNGTVIDMRCNETVSKFYDLTVSNIDYGEADKYSDGIDELLKLLKGKVIQSVSYRGNWYLFVKETPKEFSLKEDPLHAKSIFISPKLAPIDKILTEIKGLLQTTQAQEEKAAHDYGQVSMKLASAFSLISRVGHSEKKKADELGREFDHLSKIAKVKKIEVNDGNISVFTEYLHSQPVKILDNRKVDLGEFRIDIDTQNRRIRIFNLTRKVEGSYHPHINSSGEACFGNIKDQIHKLLADAQYEILIDVLMQYLVSVNEGDYMRDARKWPSIR